jgi:hypothetical protein
MNMKPNKLIAFVVAGLFVVTGTYNTVVINSESHISGTEVKFVKRLDEIYGVTVPGRMVAASVAWKKIAPEAKSFARNSVVNAVTTAPSVASAPAPEALPEVAAVQEELTLGLVEVVNPNKWQNGLAASAFNGSLSTNNGVIENLSVSLPNGEGVSVSFSEMTGNVFEYDLNGELYSGMMYQVDQNAYMVTLTNGPLEGTRLRFSSQAPVVEQEQTQQVLAESKVEVGAFGSEQVNPEAFVQNDQQMQQEAIQAQGFNLDNSQAL